MEATNAAVAGMSVQVAIGVAEDNAASFAVPSFRQGSQVGSMSAFLNARSVTDLLQREQMLSFVSASHLDVIEDLKLQRSDGR